MNRGARYGMPVGCVIDIYTPFVVDGATHQLQVGRANLGIIIKVEPGDALTALWVVDFDD